MKVLLALSPLLVAAGMALTATDAKAQGFCAPEGGFCRAPAGAVILFGAQGVYARRRSPPGGLPCNNYVFGDPIYGVPKHCRVVFPRY